MEKFQYEILFSQDQPAVPGGVNWFLRSNMNTPFGFNLPMILNQLGNQGWEVVVLGDIGFSQRPEIILKRRIG